MLGAVLAKKNYCSYEYLYQGCEPKMTMASVGFSVLHRNVGRFRFKSETETERFSVGLSVKLAAKTFIFQRIQCASVGYSKYVCGDQGGREPKINRTYKLLGRFFVFSRKCRSVWIFFLLLLLLMGCKDKMTEKTDSHYRFRFLGQPKKRQKQIGCPSAKTDKKPTERKELRFSVHNHPARISNADVSLMRTFAAAACGHNEVIFGQGRVNK